MRFNVENLQADLCLNLTPGDMTAGFNFEEKWADEGVPGAKRRGGLSRCGEPCHSLTGRRSSSSRGSRGIFPKSYVNGTIYLFIAYLPEHVAQCANAKGMSRLGVTEIGSREMVTMEVEIFYMPLASPPKTLAMVSYECLL